MLKSKPTGAIGDCFKLWYVMRPMTVDLFERYWQLTGIDEPLFDSEVVHYDQWEEGNAICYGMVHNETGKAHGIVRKVFGAYLMEATYRHG